MRARFTLSALICSAVLIAAPRVAAQEPAPEPPPDGAAPATPAPDPKVAAEERFFAAQKLYGEKRHAEALEAFRASYKLVPSPNSHLYVARCLRELGDAAGAYEAYTEVILECADRADPGAYAGTQRAATEERAGLRDRVALITVRVPPEIAGITVRVGDATAPPERYGRGVPVPAGEVTITAEAPGREPFAVTMSAAGGEAHTVEVELPPLNTGAGAKRRGPMARFWPGAPEPVPDFQPEPVAAPPPAPGIGAVPVLAAVSGGVGALGFASFGFFGLSASSRHDELSSSCGGRCGPSFQEDINAGRRETLASQIGLGIGIAGVTTGVALLLVSLAGGRRPPVRATAGAPLQLGGAF